MTNYTKTTDFAAKDSLPSGNAAKIVKGSEIDTEFNNIATASATKANANDAVLTGTTTAQTLDISGNVDVDGTLETDALSLNGVTVTSTAAELNILDGVTATATEINLLDGVTATTAELNYVDGVTSAIQTQIDTKAPLASPTFTGTVTVPGLTTTANVLLGDNDKAIFGAGSDLQIYHDGSNSFIKDAGTGILFVQGSGGVRVLGADTSENLARFNENGSVQLYYNNAEKLATTSTGITVSGAVGAPSSEDFYRIKFQDQGGIANDVGIGQPDADSLAFNFTPTAGGHIAFFAGSSEKVRIDASGRVGIGTTPDALLRVNGTAKIGEGAASNTAKLMVNTASGTAAGIQLFQDSVESWIIDNPASSTALTFSNSGTERMRIDASGNVNIGTTSAYGTNVLNVNGGIAIDGRNASTPGLCEKGDVDTGIFWPAANSLSVATGGTERMRIDSSGRVGIGATSPSVALDVQAASGASRINVGTGSVAGDHGVNVVSGGANNDYGVFFNGSMALGSNTTAGTQLKIGSNGSETTFQTLTFHTDASERMRIDSSGQLLIGCTGQTGDAPNSDGFLFQQIGNVKIRVNSDGQACQQYYSPTGGTSSPVGSITVGASSTAFNTSSDQRLKENIADADDAGSKVDAIQVRQFDWIADGSHQDYGMVAQELQSVAPEAVTGDGDSDEIMGVDYSKLVPMLVKEIQSLRARVAQLENN